MNRVAVALIESLLNIGDANLKEWIWAKQPYGLREPSTKFSANSSN